MQSDQNRMKNKKVIYICIVENQKLWRAASFRLIDITKPSLNMHKQNFYFPVIHFHLVLIFIDSSIKNSWFRKKNCAVCNVIVDFIGFSTFTRS